MEYDEGLRICREAEQAESQSQWTRGDVALSLETTYGKGTIKRLAEDLGIEYSTLRNYKDVSAAYPESDARASLYTIARTLMAQPDRAELVKTVSTVKGARELVKERNDAKKAAKLAAKEAEAAKTPQPEDRPTKASDEGSKEEKKDTREVRTTKGGNTYKSKSESLLLWEDLRQRIRKSIESATKMASDLTDYPEETEIVLGDIEEMRDYLTSMAKIILDSLKERANGDV